MPSQIVTAEEFFGGQVKKDMVVSAEEFFAPKTPELKTGPAYLTGLDMTPGKRLQQFGRLFKGETWKNVGKNILPDVGQVVAGISQMVSATPESLMLQQSAKDAQESLESISATGKQGAENIPKQLTEIGKNILPIDFVKKLWADPVQTFIDQPAMTILMLSPFAGKAGKAIMGKVGVEAITNADMAAIFKEVPSRIMPSGAKAALIKYANREWTVLPSGEIVKTDVYESMPKHMRDRMLVLAETRAAEKMPEPPTAPLPTPGIVPAVPEVPGAMVMRARKKLEAVKAPEVPKPEPVVPVTKQIRDMTKEEFANTFMFNASDKLEGGVIRPGSWFAKTPRETLPFAQRQLGDEVVISGVRKSEIKPIPADVKDIFGQEFQKVGVFERSGESHVPEFTIRTTGGINVDNIYENLTGKSAKPEPVIQPEIKPTGGLSAQFIDETGAPISYGEFIRRQKLGKPAMKVAPSPLPETSATIPTDSVEKIRLAIKEATPLRGKQEALYSAERSKRLGIALPIGKKFPTEAGFYAQKAALKGELPQVEAKGAFESIRNRVGQKDFDTLFQRVEDSSAVSGFDKLNTKEGLIQIFDGHIPQESKLALLEKVFGPDFVQTIVDKAPLFDKMKRLGLEVANIPRAVMSSMDISFGLRQGIVAATTHPKIFWGNFSKQLKFFASEKSFRAAMDDIARRPTYELMRKSKLALTDIGRNLRGREEPFQSPLAEKIPVAGKLIRASDRAYTGFASKLRADVFDYLIKRAEDAKLDPQNNLKLTKDIAKVVNTMTGRGSLGKLEPAAVTLNATFFSPRLMMSRLNMLNPVNYIKGLSPLETFARKEALKSLLSFTGTGLTVLGLAKFAGLEVGADPRSADFGKIKLGNTRVDIWGGFQQYVRLAAQLITKKTVSSTTGKVTNLGEGYKPTTRWDVATGAVEAKMAPIFSFVTDWLRGKAFGGEDFKLSSEIGKRFFPMAMQDLIDIAKDDPSLLPIGALGMMGVGLQTYSPKLRKVPY